MIMAQQFVGFAIALLVSIFAPQLKQQSWYLWALSYLPLYLVGFPVLLAVFRTIPNSTRSPQAFIKPSIRQLLLVTLASIGITYALSIFSNWLNGLVTQLKGAEVVNPLEKMLHGSGLVFNLLAVVVIAPIMEEFICRRLLYNKLIAYGGKTYILVSALLFALLHGNLYQLFYAFALGLIFAGLTYFTGTIAYSVGLHMLLNFMGSGVGQLIVAYGNQTMLANWSMTILFLMTIGLIVFLFWMIPLRKRLTLAPGLYPAPSKRLMFLNPGMLLYILVMGIIMAAAILL